MDIDGDGRDELVTGHYYNGFGVVVLYSSSGRRERIPRPTGGGDVGNAFGKTLTSGDFDGDGYADLVIGNPEEYTPEGHPYRAGDAWVYYGGASGLDVSRPVHLNQNTPGMPGTVEAGDRFASALAAGDINGDGRDDLAIGALGDQTSVGGLLGTVTVLFGSDVGLTTTGVQLITQDAPGVPRPAGVANFFGAGVAVGDMTRDGYADLAISADSHDDQSEPYENGQIVLLRGSASGVSTTGATSVTDAEVGPGRIGDTMSIADIDGDGDGDLVAGAPLRDEGYLVYVPGGAGGLDVPRARVIDMNTPGVPGAPQPTRPDDPSPARFGHAVATGDVNGDGRADVLVGARGHTVNGLTWAGAVYLIPGTAGGLTGAGSLMLTQHRQSPLRHGMSVPACEQPQRREFFGDSNAILNLDGRGALDMVTASGYENPGAGMVMRLGIQHVSRPTAGGRPTRAPVGLSTTSCLTDPGIGHSLLHR